MARLFSDSETRGQVQQPARRGAAPSVAGAAIPAPAAAPNVTTQPVERVVSVAVVANVWRAFDYIWPDAFGEPSPGRRVRVPFGAARRPALGFVVETSRKPGVVELKKVAEVVDPVALLDDGLWRLGRWISDYYLCPLGLALAAMIPSAVGRHPARTETVAYLASGRDQWPASLGTRQRAILDELLEARKQGVEPLAVEMLRRRSGATGASLQGLHRRGLIRLEARPVRLPEPAEAQQGDPFDLNEDQQAALAALGPRIAAGGFSVTLLHGVTGSGKTEVYVRAIRQVVQAGRQAILLVPEIALATQTLQRLIRRLSRVAVLHSSLTDADRAFYYEQIRQGHADVVVGPRSAVFAPTGRLGLIIVDEEHEPSYKQDSAPRYHGRDVAVKRGAICGVPVLLGSATPSLESLRNAQEGRYGLLRLPRRVRGLPMPSLQIVHLRQELDRTGRVELIGRTLTHKIAAALDRSQQVILLMNRRGYASYVLCPRCKWMHHCDHCTRPMVFHQAIQLVLCHYCRQSAPLPAGCPACGGKLLLFGLGIQRIEAELARKFPGARVARMDSDTMTSAGQFRQVLEDFAAGRTDILLGTQMVAKGLDFAGVSLVGVVSADTSLAIPDFRASERTFQLIVQVAGRAGRSEVPGEVVVQTLHADEPAIRFASRHDYDGFAAWELPLRRDAGLPPYGRVVRFIVRHAKAERAQEGAAVLAAALGRLLPADQVTLWGPQAAGVRKIRDQFRFQVLVITRQAGLVQKALAGRMDAICRDAHAEIVPDVDPVNLL